MKFRKLYQNAQIWLKNAFSKISSKGFFITLACLGILFAMALTMVLSVSLSIKNVTSERILTKEDAARLEDIDYIIILGAGLRTDGSPSDMLTDRLLTGIALIENGSTAELLLSGDNSGEHYNEVGAMYDFVSKKGIDTELVELDNNGYSTYESIYRAKNEFGAKKVLIITQEYHLHRALYISRELGMEAYGVSADIRTYRGQTYRDLREHLARFKDFLQCLVESGK